MRIGTVAAGAACLVVGAVIPWADVLATIGERLTEAGTGASAFSIPLVLASAGAVVASRWRHPAPPTTAAPVPVYPTAKALRRSTDPRGYLKAATAERSAVGKEKSEGDVLYETVLFGWDRYPFETNALLFAMNVYVLCEDASVFRDLHDATSRTRVDLDDFHVAWSSRCPAATSASRSSNCAAERMDVVRVYDRGRSEGCLPVNAATLGWLASRDPDLWCAIQAVDGHGGVRPEGLALLHAARSGKEAFQLGPADFQGVASRLKSGGVGKSRTEPPEPSARDEDDVGESTPEDDWASIFDGEVHLPVHATAAAP